MEKRPIAVVKPDMVNAIVPEFARNLIYFALFAAILSLAAYFLSVFTKLQFRISSAVWMLSSAAIILSMLVSSAMLMRLHFTRYIFYDTYVEHCYKLFSIKTKTTWYRSIVNVETVISFWDRFCRAGDVILHTAEDTAPDLKLEFIKNPQVVVEHIKKLVEKSQNIHHYYHGRHESQHDHSPHQAQF